MNKKIIGVAGGIGSFSEQSADHYCHENNITDYDLKYLISVENVLNAIDKNKIDLGILPIENSNGGIVYESVYAMSKHIFNIEKIFEVDIRHCLITKPGLDKSKITMIVSHDQALKQCKMYLKRTWPDVELAEWPDTADAVRAIKEGELPETAAAIAPSKAAEIYKMEIKEESIQDLKFNFTSFLAVTSNKS